MYTNVLILYRETLLYEKRLISNLLIAIHLLNYEYRLNVEQDSFMYVGIS